MLPIGAHAPKSCARSGNKLTPLIRTFFWRWPRSTSDLRKEPTNLPASLENTARYRTNGRGGRRGDWIGCNCCTAICRLMAQSGRTETICHLSAFGGKADIGRCIAPIISAAFDPKRTRALSKSAVQQSSGTPWRAILCCDNTRIGSAALGFRTIQVPRTLR